MRHRWRLAGALALLVVAAAPALAQRPVQRPTTRAPGRPGAPPRPATRDSAAGDSTKRELVTWAEPDSVMAELLARPGYAATRYRGQRVTFEARQRTLLLEGRPSAVQRGEAILVGDTIVFNDSLQIVQVRSDTAILRDPSYQPDDVVARRYLEYDLVNRIGTVRELSTAVESGQRWYVHGKGGGQFVNDTSAGGRSAFYVRNGSITSCEHAEPHYHFSAGEIKVVAKNLLVARPAVLYIGNVPVMWLPFIFQDMRSGRRSGIITPRFGVAELVRNSPTYRRQVDNFGYYWAINDYMDAMLSLDWRSSARGTSFDPGYIRYSGDWQYNWIDRFMRGALRTSHDRWRDGRTNTAVTWSHSQAFSQQTSFNANVNFATSSQLVRQGTLDPFQAFATIRSDANYQTQVGPFAVALGGNRQQYTNRPEVQLTLPTLSISPRGPLQAGDWLTWTPSFRMTNSVTSNTELGGSLGTRFIARPGGGVDSVRVFADRRTSSINFSTPFRIFDFDLPATFDLSEQESRGPQIIPVYAGDTIAEQRFFDRFFRTDFNWEPSFALPRISQGKLNLTPSISLRNVQSEGGFGVRTSFTGGNWVFQKKRPSYALSSAPTVFGLFPGIGPFTRFRHALNPQLTWSYSPDARGLVSDEYLRALNIRPQGNLAALAQNQVSFGLSQTIEAKLRSGADTALDGGRKIKLLALNTSPFTYDFVRADTVGRGLVTESFSYDVRSDLLPGFDFRSSYSLFQGSTNSDTARFEPFRTSMAANMSLNANSAVIVGLARLFGRRGQSVQDIETDQQGTAEQALVSQNVAAQRIAGTGSRTAPMGVAGAGQGWNMTLGYSETRSRPIVGGNVVVLTPESQCRNFINNPFQYQTCLNTAPTGAGDQSNVGIIPGATVFQSAPQRMVNGQTSFNITPRWAAQWSTSYDVERKEFGLHQVSLQRELHDWRAVFAFTQSPTGAFAFNFYIALNAQPDIKFDYNRRSFRQRRGSQDFNSF